MKTNKLIRSEKGFGALLIVLAVLFVIIAIGVMLYFLFKDQLTEMGSNSENSQSGIQQDVPLTICPTGDPESCDDPVSNQEVNEVTVEDPDGL